MKNKILSLVLALLMAASSASAVLADDVVAIDETAEEVAVVEEVEAGQYDKAIEFLANYGIFKGYDKNNTGAEDLIQRYQMALFVARIATGWVEDEVWEDGPENWSEFSDIDFAPVNSYYGALSFANQKGIIEGYGNGKFGPTDSITYQNALTMVVRTLGYTGLDWPWGYIQKAVELGLTDGITGVAYTDELTRGEVAQIVYNALFAKMKDGSNLALKNFGIEFGWEKVVITASNINTFTKLAEDKGTGVEKQFVEFKLLNDDGSLADDTYKALAADFKLDYTKHEDDLAVGKAYYVLFEKDANSELAEIVAIEDLYVGTINNEGKTDDEGEDQAYAIKKFFEDYTLVTKYTANNYLNTTASLKDEVLVWDKTADIKVMEDAGHFIAIDWNTGNILVPIEIKDNKVVDTDKDEVTENDFDGDWKVAWYRWESESGHNERYYEKQYGTDGELKGINWMSEKEFEDTYASVLYKKENKYNGFAALESYSNTAYASLDLFDTNLDGVADRGLYESYKLGYFSNTTEKCSKCDKEYATWTLSAVGTEEKSVGESAPKTELWIEGTCDHHSHAWFVEGYTPVVDEDGEYENGYVIYNYDDETGAIKVVKNIEDGSDEDTYVATGVLRAYNTAKETITIGEDKLTMNYDELDGTGFLKVNDSNANKTKFDKILYKYFNQFVKYVVVDGELVHVELIGQDTNDVIVVVSYAGLSNDGYVVVNGYKTDDLKYTQFRLASIEGWKEGDIYYYADNYEGFEQKGMVLSVSSYDEGEDVYFVEYFAGYDVEDGDYWVESEMSDRIAYESDGTYLTKFVWDETKAHQEDGVWCEGDWVEDGFVKMTSSDKYILVPDWSNGKYAPVTVWEGKLPAGAWIEGERIKKTDDNTFVFVKAWSHGFEKAYDTGLVVLLDKDFDKADYNGEDAEDWYLLGAVEYEVRAFDVFTGEFDVVRYAENKNFDVKEAYLTYGNVMVEDAGLNGYALIHEIRNIAANTEDYIVEDINFIEDGEVAVVAEEDFGANVKADVTAKDLYVTDKDAHLAAFEKALLADGVINDYKFRGDKIKGVTYREITIDEDGEIVSITKDYEGDKTAEKFGKLADKYSELNGFYVFNKETGKVVVYIVFNADEFDTTETKTNVAGTVKVNGDVAYDNTSKNDKDPIIVAEWEDGDVYLAAEVGYSYDTVNGDIDAVTVKDITLTFAGDLITGNKKEGIKALDPTESDFGYYYSTPTAAKVVITGEDAVKEFDATVTPTVYTGTTKNQTLKFALDVDEDDAADAIECGNYIVKVVFSVGEAEETFEIALDVIDWAVVGNNTIVENVVLATGIIDLD